MRNLKLFYHWIAEVRDIARKAGVYNEENDDDQQPMSEVQLREIFSRENFQSSFEEGLSPKEAFDEEMERWADDRELWEGIRDRLT